MKRTITALLICCMLVLMGAKAHNVSPDTSSYLSIGEEFSVANDNDKTQEG